MKCKNRSQGKGKRADCTRTPGGMKAYVSGESPSGRACLRTPARAAQHAYAAIQHPARQRSEEPDAVAGGGLQTGQEGRSSNLLHVDLKGPGGLPAPPPLHYGCAECRPSARTTMWRRRRSGSPASSRGRRQWDAEERDKLIVGGPELCRGAGPQALVGTQPGKPRLEEADQGQITSTLTCWSRAAMRRVLGRRTRTYARGAAKSSAVGRSTSPGVRATISPGRNIATKPR